jgi:hypothetical protein
VPSNLTDLTAIKNQLHLEESFKTPKKTTIELQENPVTHSVNIKRLEEKLPRYGKCAALMQTWRRKNHER